MRISAKFLGWITTGVVAWVGNIILISWLMEQDVELLRVWLLSPLTALVVSSNVKFLLNYWPHVDLTAANGKGYDDVIVKTTEDNARWFSSILSARSEETKELMGPIRNVYECLITIDKAKEEARELQIRLGNISSTLTRASSSAGVVVTTISRANEAHEVINSLMKSLRERFQSIPKLVIGFSKQYEEMLTNIKEEIQIALDCSPNSSFNISSLEERILSHTALLDIMEDTVENIKTSIVYVVSEAEVKKTLLKEGILSPKDENGGYNESQTRNVEENELWTTKIPRDILESTALEAAQRALAGLAEGDAVDLHSNYKCVTNEMVYKALRLQAADGTGLVDYAESPGGYIISHSETWTPKGFSFLQRVGEKLKARNSAIGKPLEAISRNSDLGRCWAMDGSIGFITVRLAKAIRVDSVSLEHIPVQLIGDMAVSALKTFQVWAYPSVTKDGLEDNLDPTLLVEGTYNLTGPPIQLFEVNANDGATTTTAMARLDILDNHGNQDYTCLYRFRVHGTPQ